MPRMVRELGPLEISRITAPGYHAVGGVPGLCLQVAPSGSRSWVLRVVVGSKRREMGLGGFPAVTLGEARRKAREHREHITQGVDPVDARKAARSALIAAQARALTFDECAAAYIKAHEAAWKNGKHVQQWRNTLTTYASPVLGGMLVRDVEMVHVLRVLEPIWHTKTETASRVRGRMEAVFDWAKGRGLRTGDNPAAWKGNLDAQLARPDRVTRTEHHAALPVGEVGGFMARLREAEGMGALALHFAILTAARSGEVRGATWSEVDLTERTWTIPAGRMKAGKEHRVPLSPAAVDLLQDIQKREDCDLVFPSVRNTPLSDMTLSAVLRRLQVDAVPHGFRSTFRDWAAERTNYPREVAEMALAHTIGNKVEAAYRRGDLFEKRRRMMNEWAAFLSRSEDSSAVVPLARARTA